MNGFSLVIDLIGVVIFYQKKANLLLKKYLANFL